MAVRGPSLDISEVLSRVADHFALHPTDTFPYLQGRTPVGTVIGNVLAEHVATVYAARPELAIRFAPADQVVNGMAQIIGGTIAVLLNERTGLQVSLEQWSKTVRTGQELAELATDALDLWLGGVTVQQLLMLSNAPPVPQLVVG